VGPGRRCKLCCANGPSAPAMYLFLDTFSLGPPDPRRRSEFKNARMSVIFKTHKTPIEDRNVVRLFDNDCTAASQLLRRMLVQVLEEEENAWETQGLVFPVFRNIRHYLKHLEELSAI
jgi:hypothetical protein